MARPQKLGLDYFPFDVDFFADRKIKVLFARFGCEGVAFYLYILCEIYRDKGFFVQCDDEFLEVASAELQIERKTLLRLLDFMVERQLIHGGLLEEFGVLTSRGIQARYQRAKENAGRKTPVPVRKELWLMSGRETSAFIQVRGHEAPVKNADKAPPLRREKRREEVLPEVEEQKDTEGGTMTQAGSVEAMEAGGRKEKGCRRTGEAERSSRRELQASNAGKIGCEIDNAAGGLLQDGQTAAESKESAADNRGTEQIADGNRREVGLAGACPDGEEAVFWEKRGKQDAGRGQSHQKASLESVQCIPRGNSGGNNPQRKENKRKLKEKGGEPLLSDADQRPGESGRFGEEKFGAFEGTDYVSRLLPCARQRAGEAVWVDGEEAGASSGGDGGKADLSCAEEGWDSGTGAFQRREWQEPEKEVGAKGNAPCAKRLPGGGDGDFECEISAKPQAVSEAEETVKLVREAFASVPRNFRREIGGFLREGAPAALVRYAVEEANRLGKPYSYMAAILRQRLAEGRLETGNGRRSPASYDLEAFEKLGFHVPKIPKQYGGKPDGTTQCEDGAAAPEEENFSEQEEIR